MAEWFLGEFEGLCGSRIREERIPDSARLWNDEAARASAGHVRPFDEQTGHYLDNVVVFRTPPGALGLSSTLGQTTVREPANASTLGVLAPHGGVPCGQVNILERRPQKEL